MLGAITFVWLRRTLRTSDVHARAMAVNKRGALCALLVETVVSFRYRDAMARFNQIDV